MPASERVKKKNLYVYILFTLFTINSCPKALNNSDFPYQCHVWIYRIITNCENDTTATKKSPKS